MSNQDTQDNPIDPFPPQSLKSWRKAGGYYDAPDDAAIPNWPDQGDSEEHVLVRQVNQPPQAPDPPPHPVHQVAVPPVGDIDLGHATLTGEAADLYRKMVEAYNEKQRARREHHGHTDGEAGGS